MHHVIAKHCLWSYAIMRACAWHVGRRKWHTQSCAQQCRRLYPARRSCNSVPSAYLLICVPSFPESRAYTFPLRTFLPSAYLLLCVPSLRAVLVSQWPYACWVICNFPLFPWTLDRHVRFIRQDEKQLFTCCYDSQHECHMSVTCCSDSQHECHMLFC